MLSMCALTGTISPWIFISFSPSCSLLPRVPDCLVADKDYRARRIGQPLGEMMNARVRRLPSRMPK